MDLPKNNQEFYQRLDRVTERLNELGMHKEGKRIYHLLHEMVWTTSSELLPAIETYLRSLISSDAAAEMPQDLKEELIGYVTMLEKI